MSISGEWNAKDLTAVIPPASRPLKGGNAGRKGENRTRKGFHQTEKPLWIACSRGNGAFPPLAVAAKGGNVG